MIRFILLLVFGMFMVVVSSTAFAQKMFSFPKSHCQHPKWSFNGKKLSFEVHDVLHRSIGLKILDVSSGNLKDIQPEVTKASLDLGLEQSKKGVVARELSWSRNSEKYIFTSNGNGSVYNLYMSGEGRLRINSSSQNDGQGNWDSTGRRIVFSSGRSGKGDLYWFDARKMIAKRLTRFSNATELFPVFSPTHALQIAYLKHTDQTDKIYIIPNLFAPKSKRLTHTPLSHQELNPSWSPKGKHIAYFSVDSKGVYNLNVSDLDGKSQLLAQNVAKSDQFGPAWSPDGQKLFYVQKIGQDKDKIMAIDVSSKKKTEIATDTVVNDELAITQRGKQWVLAFTALGKTASTEKSYRKLFLHTMNPF